MSNFPGSLPSAGSASASSTLAAAGHTSLHNTGADETRAIATKVGTGSSSPTSGLALLGTGIGTSAWGQVNLTAGITGVLPVANGGTGVSSSTGSGAVVLGTAPTISGAQLTGSPTLTTPTIADFTNATHTHANNAGGGQLTGSTALVNSTVTADKLNTGAQKASVVTSETTANTGYNDLATPGPTVTVTIGANGLALVIISVTASNNTNGDYVQTSPVISGANTKVAGAVGTPAVYRQVPAGGNDATLEHTELMTGLNPGSTTFKLQYGIAGGGTGTFSSRLLAVIPL